MVGLVLLLEERFQRLLAGAVEAQLELVQMQQVAPEETAALVLHRQLQAHLLLGPVVVEVALELPEGQAALEVGATAVAQVQEPMELLIQVAVVVAMEIRLVREKLEALE
jgi:hypothetical protein